jgi:ABC-type glycerol-3-phosphate transport system substrate-binding protein
MSKFQIILTGIFVICIIAGVITFATFKGGNTDTELPAISIWGTFPKDSFDKYVSKISEGLAQPLKITYSQIAESNFDDTFIQALARGQGPDVILVSQDQIHKHEDKIILIPYSTLSKRDFQNTFIRQAELYFRTDGVMGLPFVVDPLVMYWNRDTFTNVGVANPPKFWDEFTSLNTKITQKDVNSNVRKSAIALGEFNNVLHAREILGTLMLQHGNPITYRDNSGYVLSALGNRQYSGLDTSVQALDFFTKFSNPSSPDYSWNRSLSNSKSSFLSGTLATYFGFASEIMDIQQKNPNLDFDVSALPQLRNGSKRIVYGSMYGFSIVRSSANANGAFSVLSTLLNPASLSDMVSMSYLPPVRRDMISSGSIDPYLTIFYESALISGGWLDSNKTASNRIFQGIVESVTSGREEASRAMQNGSDEFDILLAQ